MEQLTPQTSDGDHHASAERADPPAMPAMPPARLYPDPQAITTGGRYSIGWQDAPKFGPAFVLVRFNAIGTAKVLERFPLTEDGWATAWAALVQLDAGEARAVAAVLRGTGRQTADSGSESPGTVTIWERGRRGLYYDDLGLTVRSRASRLEQYAWSEIGRLADGGVTGDGDNPDHWALIIVLHTGREVNVICPRSSPTPEMLAAITLAARCHGIPADVTGILMKGGKPFRSGLYEDPWGQAGLRYWDKERWSPLLPSDFESSRSRKWWIAVPTARKSAASWSALPRAHGAWPFAADRARRCAVWMALWASLSATLLTVGLLIDLWWDHGAHHKHYSGNGWFACAASAVGVVFLVWTQRRYYLRLDKAAKESGA